MFQSFFTLTHPVITRRIQQRYSDIKFFEGVLRNAVKAGYQEIATCAARTIILLRQEEALEAFEALCQGVM